MKNGVPLALYDDDLKLLYFAWEPHEKHNIDGTHRFDEPVSGIRINDIKICL